MRTLISFRPLRHRPTRGGIPPRPATWSFKEGLQLFSIIRIVGLCLIGIGVAGCSKPSAQADRKIDYKAATVSSLRATVYQKSREGDDVLTLVAQLTFKDGEKKEEFLEISYEGLLADAQEICVFELDDIRSLEDPSKTQFIIRRCDGKTSQGFKLGDYQISIAGHVTDAHVSEFYVDRVSGPKGLRYFRRHAPDENESSGYDD